MPICMQLCSSRPVFPIQRSTADRMIHNLDLLFKCLLNKMVQVVQHKVRVVLLDLLWAVSHDAFFSPSAEVGFSKSPHVPTKALAVEECVAGS